MSEQTERSPTREEMVSRVKNLNLSAADEERVIKIVNRVFAIADLEEALELPAPSNIPTSEA